LRCSLRSTRPRARVGSGHEPRLARRRRRRRSDQRHRNSPNVVAAVELGRLASAVTIALTGQSGGRLKRLAHLTVRVPADAGERIEQVEDAHLAIGHSLCVALRRRLSGRRNADSTPERQQALPTSVADLIVIERAADATIASS
jgi:fructoselysine-6-P-deglycase FrlB-like protein